jgi:hypothetical protein
MDGWIDGWMDGWTAIPSVMLAWSSTIYVLTHIQLYYITCRNINKTLSIHVDD